MQMTVEEIADFLKGEVVGDGKVMIKGVCGIKEAKPGDITFLANSRYNHLVSQTCASAIITSPEMDYSAKPLIRVGNPSLAFANIVDKFYPRRVIHPEGIHPSAIIAKSVKLGKDVGIGAYTVVEENVVIGDDTKIYPGCYIGRDTRIGNHTLIYANVSIRESITVGNRVVIQSGSVIGSDGFGFITQEGKHKRVPQIGTVVIEDDVEIGANVTIDRARFNKTIIAKGTKIDNLVQIAHNVVIGQNCFIIAQAGISGSTTIGNNTVLAGQAGLVGHISVGDNAVVAAQAGVTKSVPANVMVSGYPARPHSIAKRINACIQNLPGLYKTVAEIKQAIGDKFSVKTESKQKAKKE
ncbi:MAG: UDP-3-O-(3-hydroxymyristoyl)glucosamine N-acyltransferase [Candidatus Omnitrophota bacterium]|jgi:UDP-3-O-[3-hydroxymyristoyl] glucosamine N-acyltransferase